MHRGFCLTLLAGLAAWPVAAQDRSLAFQWDGLQGPIAGVMSPEDATRYRLRLQLPSPERDCVGTLSLAKGGTEGSWALGCPGGLAASGVFTARRPGRDGEGSGSDTSGRRVVFTAGPPLAARSPTTTPSAPPPAARKDPTAEDLNQAELERQRAARHEELQRQVRRNHEEAEAARAAKPPAQTAAAPPAAPPAAATAPAIASDAGSDVACGFFKVRGLSLRASSIKCEESQRSGLGGHGNSTLKGASLTVAVQPGNAFLSVFGERDVDGIGGFRTASPAELNDRAKRWGGTRGGRNYSGPTGSPFQHVKMTITVSNNPWACAYGLMEGNRRAWGTSAARSYAYVTYCEPNQQLLSEANLQKVGAAILLD